MGSLDYRNIRCPARRKCTGLFVPGEHFQSVTAFGNLKEEALQSMATPFAADFEQCDQLVANPVRGRFPIMPEKATFGHRGVQILPVVDEFAIKYDGLYVWLPRHIADRSARRSANPIARESETVTSPPAPEMSASERIGMLAGHPHMLIK